MRLRVLNDRVSRIKRCLKPLMAVGCPRIRLVNSVGQMLEFRVCTCPKPEGGINMQPSVSAMGYVGNIFKRVKRTRINLPCLANYNFWTLMAGNLMFQIVRDHPPHIICLDTNDALIS